ncbi:amino acid adenylation domain-containing protein, partial [Roseiflexus sp.]|uniref:amino acid adenylation domain-containing protein n=1 Tax=Roseiflexus sp. TaxID=2562120 RepID=UPI00398A852A
MSDRTGRIERLSPAKRALLIERLRQSQQHNAVIAPRADRDVFPLSFAQRRMWFLHQLDPESAAYNMPALLRLRGRLNTGALHSSLREILRRHDVLRAHFATIHGEPEQVIEAIESVPLPLIALDQLPAGEREMTLERLAEEEARRPFDLGCGPLFRMQLVRLSPDDHALIIVAHHIAADGWSIEILLRELGALYTSYVEGKPSLLAPLALQYADYAVWQRAYLEERVAGSDGEPVSRRERQLSFWRAHLSDVPALELPADHPCRLTQHVTGRQFTFALPADAIAALRTLAAQEGATPFMALLALFETLLARYSGQDLFAVGIPVAGRTHAELEPLVGCFVNTLALRADLSGAPTFRELLRRTRDMALEAYANQDVPFDLVIEALHPERERDRTPLIRVMFDLQREPAQHMRLPDLQVERTSIANGTTKFDLSLTVIDDDATLRGLFEYDADLFDADTIERMAGHLVVLGRGAIEDPDRPITLLPLLTDAERRQILIEWNQMDAPFDAERCIHDLFEDQVRRTPHATAVAFADQALTFEELNRRANQLAHLLHAHGVGPDVLVGLHVARSVDLIVGLLGILKAGGAYVPLDPIYPAQRLAWMIEDSQAPLIVTQQALEPHLPQTGATLIRLDADRDAIAALPDNTPAHTATSRNLAYVIFTSGSTGRPKGVMIEHRSALNLAAALQRMIYDRYPGERLRIALNAPLAFDASFQQIVMLIYGHTLDIVPQDLRLDGRALLAYLRDRRIDGFDCVPSQLRLLLDAGLLDGSGWTPRLALPGGEAIDEGMWQTLAHAPATDFFNMYGPTECTVDVTTICVRAAPARATIGRPMANVRAYILDAHQQPVPIGVPGELYIGGVCVGRGYLGRPDLTAERFVEIDDPWTGGKQRVYRTGDQCRFRRDGTIEYLGRLDHQVKIRGFRIEPGEVEAVLCTVAGVQSAAVVAWGEQSERRRLVAYVTPATIAPADVLHELRRVLPDYMTPAAIVPLAALPLTPNGKIDRRALPPPDQLRADDDVFIPPRTPLERSLADVWRQVLGLERIGVDERFFALGGNSIQAAVLANRLRDVLGVDVPVRLVFEAPTVAEQAEALISRYPHLAQGNEPLLAETFPQAPRDGDLPLSFAQQRLWVLEQIDPGSPLYHIAGAVRLTGKLDVAALHRCLNDVVRRHESLRATFHEVEGKAVQRIAPPESLDLPLVDLSGAPHAGREEQMRRLMTVEARRPFDLTRGPLLRALLVRLSGDEHVVLLVVHHIAADGWSFEILLRDIGTLYPAFAAGQLSPLPDPAVQYADYAIWQRERLGVDSPAGSDADVEAQAATPLQSVLAYWQRQLAGAPPLLDLPTDRPRPAVQSHNGARLGVELPPPLLAALRSFARNEDVTLFTVLLAGLNGLLLRYTGQEDLCIGMPVAGRTHRAVEDVVGFFVNTLVLRTDLSGSPSFRETVRRVQRVLIEALAHQEAPFERVVDVVQPERTLTHTPLFQVMADMQHDSLQRLELPDLTLTPLMVDVGVAKFDLTFSFVERGDRLSCSIEYNTDLFDEATVARMVHHLQTLLAAALAEPDHTLDRLPILTPDERRQLLVEWNATTAPFPADRCAHDLFIEQVQRTPDALALICEESRVTYAELDRRANQLAHYLQRWGLGPDRLAGICLERSPDMIVALLAVLKAGGAYVPLDPTYPAERLRFMIDDACPTLIVSHTSVTTLPAVHDLPVLHLDAHRIEIDGEPITPPVSQARPDHLAYVIYTSGSTGQPKGVLLTHCGLTNLATAYRRDFALGPGSRVLQFFAFSFDGSVADIFMALLSGATLCMPGRDTVRSPDDLIRFMQAHRVTLATLPPAMLALLDPEALPSLTTVISAGERVSPDLVRRWATGRRVINAYGPTEATVAAAWYDATDLPCNAVSVPIGRPLANIRLFVLSSALQLAPVGVPGELFIGGVGVARGYLNRPALTAERFVDLALPTDQLDVPVICCRAYRTGDRVRWRADGNLEFLGRFDDQVKVRGFRIELGEIEATLRTCPHVDDAVAVVREDQPGVRRLVAYLTPATAPVAAIRAWIAARLPEHMMPAVLVPLEALPLSPSGKVDRRALPRPDGEGAAATADDAAPRDALERTLAAIWAEVLGVARVGRTDNFFALGGDSILSIQAVARARQAGISLKARDL